MTGAPEPHVGDAFGRILQRSWRSGARPGEVSPSSSATTQPRFRTLVAGTAWTVRAVHQDGAGYAVRLVRA
ncbi:hypothetical protein [Jiangella gansuensis]|uniref:hypothetical protein n=1 Tax=Jiangella gansuensis TaxID=281473 RepID=UPI00047CD716|nr:hypothetical protein [Jiangella gansuensis]